MVSKPTKVAKCLKGPFLKQRKSVIKERVSLVNNRMWFVSPTDLVVETFHTLFHIGTQA